MQRRITGSGNGGWPPHLVHPPEADLRHRRRPFGPQQVGGWIVLGAAIVAAILFSVAAFAALIIGMSSRQRSLQITESRLRAQYAAEAGLVWAAQRLWADPDILVTPTKCFSANPDFSLDTDGPGPLPPTVVDIIATPCPGGDVALKAKVTY